MSSNKSFPPGTDIKNPEYIPIMIFSVLFTAFMVLFACRCRQRSRAINKIKHLTSVTPASPDISLRTSINSRKTEGMPEVDHQAYSPVLNSPAVRGRDKEPEEEERDCNGAASRV